VDPQSALDTVRYTPLATNYGKDSGNIIAERSDCQVWSGVNIPKPNTSKANESKNHEHMIQKTKKQYS
jgi:hypothetical protein